MESNSMPVPPAPMDARVGKSGLIRPIELLRQSWAQFKSNWKLLVGIVVLPTFLIFLGQIFSFFESPIVIAIGAILFIIGMVYTVAMQAAAILSIDRLSKESGAKLVIREQYKLGFKYFWSLVYLMILQVLIMAGSFTLLVIPAIVVGIYIGMNAFALILDGKKGMNALTEMYTLVWGKWWPVLGRTLFLILIYIIASIIFGIIASIIQAIFGVQANTDAAAIFTLVSNFILGAILGPIYLIYMYNLYGSLKATRTIGVNPSVFRRWLIAFMVIGIIALMVIIISAILISSVALIIGSPTPGL